MEGRGLTYLVKELVLSKVPDVLWLLHGRKTRGDRERPISCDKGPWSGQFSWLSASCPWQPPKGPPLHPAWPPRSDPGANVIPCQPAGKG